MWSVTPEMCLRNPFQISGSSRPLEMRCLDLTSFPTQLHMLIGRKLDQSLGSLSFPFGTILTQMSDHAEGMGRSQSRMRLKAIQRYFLRRFRQRVTYRNEPVEARGRAGGLAHKDLIMRSGVNRAWLQLAPWVGGLTPRPRE